MSTPTMSAEDNEPPVYRVTDFRLFKTLLEKFKNDKTNSRIEVFLINGIKLVGKIVDYDDEGLLIDSPNQGMSLVRRSAISTIMWRLPLRQRSES